MGLALLFVALRWNNWTAPLVRDEGEYAYAAQLLGQGQAPYTHTFLQKPPMVAYSYALAHILAPQWFWAPRLLAGLFVALTTVLIGWIARRAFGPGVAFPAMWFFTAIVIQPGIEQFTANTEMFLLLPLMAVVAVFALSPRPASSRTWFFAGLLGAAALCYKYTAAPILAWVYAAWAIEEWRTRHDGRALGRQWAAAMLGGAMFAAAALGWFLVSDGGWRLWECTVWFNRFYAASGHFGWPATARRLGLFWNHWWILFLLPCALAVWRPRRLGFWLGLFALAWLTTARSWYGHYYIVVTPFWALLAAAGLRPLAHWIASRLSGPEAWVRRALTAATVILVCLSNIPWMTLSPARFAFRRLEHASPFLESELVARRVAAITSPADTVLVAGSEPQILCYARRFSPTRFVIAYPFMVPTPLAERYQREVIHDVEAHPPKVVVIVCPAASWCRQPASPTLFHQFLGAFLAEHYERVGGFVVEGPNTGWMEPLPESELPKTSLIVMQRKSS